MTDWLRYPQTLSLAVPICAFTVWGFWAAWGLVWWLSCFDGRESAHDEQPFFRRQPVVWSA
jgi:hypothetical protein